MRRTPLLATFVVLAALAAGFLAAPAAADMSRTLLGSAGEVYTIQRGAWGNLFADAPAGSEGNVVLALDVVRDGKLKRFLVPGTDGPADDQDPALAFDTVGNRVYAVWQSDHVFSVAGFAGADGWKPAVELAGDPASVKRNPQLATSVVRYQRDGADGEIVDATRTMLHLVYFEEGAPSGHLAYTTAAIEDGNVIAGRAAFDLRSVAGNAPASANAAPSPPSLLQRPVARRGRDNDNIGIAFVDDPRNELVTLELRPIDAALQYLADKSRAVIIETGHGNHGKPLRDIVEKSRAVIVETGRRCMHPVVADFLTRSFLDSLTDADPSLELEQAVDLAWSTLITTGIMLQQGTTPDAVHVMELTDAASDGTSRAVDVRWVSRRGLPTLPPTDFKLFLSPKAQVASIAWNAPAAVRYRESNAMGWNAVSTLAIGPNLTREQAFKLVEERLDDQ